MKTFFKYILIKILGNQVVRLRKKNNFKIIGVVGSIGKTSTKTAVAKVLEHKWRVLWQSGNYNDLVSVPLVFFGRSMPNLYDIFAWLKVIIANELSLLKKIDYDFVVIEMGTDGPGQIRKFEDYVYNDIAIITAVTAEHMESFKTIDNVSIEEWSVRYFSKDLYVNRDLVKTIPDNIDRSSLYYYDKNINYHNHFIISEVQKYSLSVAIDIAKKYGMSEGDISVAVKNVNFLSGRMQKLEGLNDSVIIDDSYNASPEAMKMALDTLYAYPRKNKIAILGSMNELGNISEQEHRIIGKYCDPSKIDLLVTIGEEAAHISDEAVLKGCQVYKTKNPYDAGDYVKNKVDRDTVILVKGSQNGVFSEEAIKPILNKDSDYSRLVRQEDKWMKIKKRQFGFNLHS